MKKLSAEQMLEISGGIGCVCQPDNFRNVKLNHDACMVQCCEDRKSISYYTFEDGPQPVSKVDLGRVPYERHECSPSSMSLPQLFNSVTL